MQRGKGAAGLPAGAGSTTGVDWLHLATYESLCEDIGTQQGHAVGAAIVGYVIDKTTSEKPALGDLLPGTMLWKRDTNSDEVTPVECSFLVVDSARRAADMLKAYLLVRHKRLAKIYFTAESNNIGQHVVCYEKLTPYPTNSPDMHVLKEKRTWQLTTREVFEAIDELLKHNHVRKVFGSPENSNYLFYAKRDDNYGFPHMEKGNSADIIKFISAVPIKKLDDEIRKKQLSDILELFGKVGARELDQEYFAFRSLVKERKSYNLSVFLGHPFVLCSDMERVDIVEVLNEAVHHFDKTELKNYEQYMNSIEKLPWLISKNWKKVVSEKGFARISRNELGKYGDTFQDLLRFLRNFITHERDEALQHDINLGRLHATVYQPFGAFLSWTYTFIHKTK